MLDEKISRRLMKEGFKTAKGFDWRNIAGKVRDVYKRVVEDYL